MSRRSGGAARLGARAGPPGSSSGTAAANTDDDLPIRIRIGLQRLPEDLQTLAQKWGLPAAAAEPIASAASAAPAAGSGRGRGRGRGGRGDRRPCSSAAASVADLHQHLDELGQFLRSCSPVAFIRFLRAADEVMLLRALLSAEAAAPRVPAARIFGADDQQYREFTCLTKACILAAEILDPWGQAADAAAARPQDLAPPLPPLHCYADQLLRLQPLHSRSRQLAQALELVLAAVPEIPPQGTGLQRRMYLFGMLDKISDLINSCTFSSVYLFSNVLWIASSGGGGGGANGGNHRQFARELAAALHDSCLVEHVSRSLLHVLRLWPETAAVQPQQGGNDAGNGRQGEAFQVPVCMSVMFLSMLRIIDSLSPPANPPAGDADDTAAAIVGLLRPALAGRCVRTAAQLLGLAALCAADGGPSYGLSPSFLNRLPVWAPDGSPAVLTAVEAAAGGVRPGGADPRVAAPPRLHADAPLALITSLPDGSEASPSPPPPGRRASVAVLLRLGNWGVESAKAAEAAVMHGGRIGTEAGGEAVPQPQPPIRAMLTLKDAPVVAVRALTRAHSLLEPRAGSPAWAAEVEECWRLTFASVRHGMWLAASTEMAAAARLLVAGLGGAGEGLSPGHAMMAVPPLNPYQAAALSAGLLPCLELLLRRAAPDPHCPAAGVLQQALQCGASPRGGGLVTALAYGNRDQAAALLVTTGKVLRLAERSTEPTAAAVRSGAACRWALEAAHGTLEQIGAVLRAPPLPPPAVPPAQPLEQPVPPPALQPLEQAAASPQGQQMAAAQRQLSELLSYGAGDWLPPLSRIAIRAVDGTAAQWMSGGAGLARTELELRVLPLLRGLPSLAALCLMQDTETNLRHRRRQEGEAATPGGGGAPETAAVRQQSSVGSAEAGAEAGAEASTSQTPATTATAAAVGATSLGGWRRLLVNEMDALKLLRTLLGTVQAMLAASPAAGSGCGDGPFREEAVVQTARACCAVAAACPTEYLRSWVSGRGTAAALQELNLYAQGESSAFWHPWHLRYLAVTLRLYGRYDALAGAVAALAEQMQRWGCDNDSDVVDWGKGVEKVLRTQVPLPSAVAVEAVEVAAEGGGAGGFPLLPPPEEARRRLQPRRCANAACANLEGDSEAELRLSACGGCGEVGYCCRDCQVADWRAGHKEACGAERRVEGGG